MAGCDDCAVDRSPLATSVESTLTLTLGLVGATFIPPRLQNDGVATPEMCIIMFVCLCGCIVFLLVVVIHHRSLVSLTRLPHFFRYYQCIQNLSWRKAIHAHAHRDVSIVTTKL